jgi:hypothetical protein
MVCDAKDENSPSSHGRTGDEEEAHGHDVLGLSARARSGWHLAARLSRLGETYRDRLLAALADCAGAARLELSPLHLVQRVPESRARPRCAAPLGTCLALSLVVGIPTRGEERKPWNAGESRAPSWVSESSPFVST